ncbi:polysaccharide lyase family 14 protein [Moniliophthora roreri]|uniref:Putative polysaccharide lyase family 14 protein n=1 Tax=Moniliophthora roreri TaxID=221103 RepID=A0A0W0FGT7_MONRR|nr:polysaccharide lyase family 14 protein [Moniliophthora roreri]
MASLRSFSLFKPFTVLSTFPLVMSDSAGNLASLYSLSTSTSFPFPSATLSGAEAQSHIVSKWSLSKGRIQDGPKNIAFVNDPFPSSGASSTGPVLQVTYGKGSYSHDTGGTQFENLWNTTDGSAFQSMMLSYEIAFDQGFEWVKGGKLPGLRGGPNATGCSGGNQPNGRDCFSARLMWRKDGAGEVYGYLQAPNSLCKEKSVTCNSDFGISISRGSFTFAAGQWNRVTLLVQLNDPVDVANGNLQLYFNDVQVVSQQDLQFRTSSKVNANGLFFSTFFGGDPSIRLHVYVSNQAF